MKILLFGATGQIGTYILKYLNTDSRFKVQVNQINGKTINLLDKKNIVNFLQENPADLYINSAAYTDVEAAENNKRECFALNVEFIDILTDYLSLCNKPLIHFSSDYVYGNNGSDYLSEENILEPCNYYGYSKKLSEEIIFNKLNFFFIFRTSWVYSNLRSNFFLSIKKKFLTNDTISVVNDQIGTPNPAWYLARIIFNLIKGNKIKQNLSGVYNLSAKKSISWYDFAVKIKKTDNRFINKEVIPIESNSYNFIAVRQKNSRLNCSKIENNFKIKLENWDKLFYQHLLEN